MRVRLLFCYNNPLNAVFVSLLPLPPKFGAPIFSIVLFLHVPLVIFVPFPYLLFARSCQGLITICCGKVSAGDGKSLLGMLKGDLLWLSLPCSNENQSSRYELHK